MKISVVTACYNQERTVRETIQSVVGQSYPELQYIFIDGASTDSTFDIAKEYTDSIDVLISEADDGQYHAIQKGFDHADGEIMAWLNGDDNYHPWTFSVVNEIFREYPEIEWIIGLPTFMNGRGQCTKVSNETSGYPAGWIANGWYRSHLAGYLQQESMFWRKSLWDKAGGLDLSLDLAADFELWTRFARHARLVSVSVSLAAFRVAHGQQRSSISREAYEKEVLEVCKPLKAPPHLWHFVSQLGIVWRALCRFIAWRKAPAVGFSESRDRWILFDGYRPVSRDSWAGLLMERQCRKPPSTPIK